MSCQNSAFGQREVEMDKKITWDTYNLDINLFSVGENYSRDEIRSIGSLPPNPGSQENWGGIVRLKNI